MTLDSLPAPEEKEAIASPRASEASPRGAAAVVTGIRQALILAGIMLASLAGYLSVEWGVAWWRGPDVAINTQMAWDHSIPFWPGWVWVYLVPYLVGPVVVGLLSRETFAWYVRRGIPLVLTSLVIFAIVPTHTVRPDASHLGTGITADLYRNMISIDGPAGNAAPSLHVSLTGLLALALLKDFPRWRAVSIVGISVVWLSTLFTHQHHIVDVVTGAGMALLFGAPLPWKRTTTAGQV
jgi:membrane-associated phospholipid phosphatase